MSIFKNSTLFLGCFSSNQSFPQCFEIRLHSHDKRLNAKSDIFYFSHHGSYYRGRFYNIFWFSINSTIKATYFGNIDTIATPGQIISVNKCQKLIGLILKFLSIRNFKQCLG